MDEYHGPERRKGLSEDEIERIAEVAATKALERVYAQVGKSVLTRVTWVLGAAFIGLLMWMGGKGIPIK
jgi:preprotein translocase subunit SecG